MPKRDNDFLEKLRVNVDYSAIDFEKYKNLPKGTDSSDGSKKDERERDKARELTEKTKKSAENREFNEFSERLPGGYSAEMLLGSNRNRFIEHVIALESDYLGIDAPSFYNYTYMGPEPSYGMYFGAEGIVVFKDKSTMKVDRDTIYFNNAIPVLSEIDYRNFLDTIIHEVRHKYQDMVKNTPDQYQEVTENGRRYLMFSDKNYDRDSETFEGYWNNGLEQDARSYARARTDLYMAYSIDEVMALCAPPRQSAINQILMGAGEQFPDGRIAPITVSQTFDSEEFAQVRNGKNIETINISNKSKKGGNTDMAMNQGTDFSEAAQNQAAKVYGNLIESIQSFSEKVVEHFVERVKTHPYRQLENVGNVFLKFYNEQLPKEIKNAISTWISSDNSFSASLKEQYEGNESASVSAAQKTENKLTEQVDACFKNIPPIRINSPISVDIERIISDAEYIEGIGKQLANLKDKWLERFSKYGEQNSLYATMMPMVATTFTNVESGYQATYKDIMNISEEFRDARSVVVSRDSSRGTELKRDIINRLDSFKQSRKNIH